MHRLRVNVDCFRDVYRKRDARRYFPYCASVRVIVCKCQIRQIFFTKFFSRLHYSISDSDYIILDKKSQNLFPIHRCLTRFLLLNLETDCKLTLTPVTRMSFRQFSAVSCVHRWPSTHQSHGKLDDTHCVHELYVLQSKKVKFVATKSGPFVILTDSFAVKWCRPVGIDGSRSVRGVVQFTP